MAREAEFADCQARLERLVSGQTDIKGALVTKEDGRIIVTHMGDMPAEGLASMGASLVGLGSALAEAVAHGANEFVFLQNRDGYVVSRAIAGGYRLTVVADRWINTELLLSVSQSAAEELGGALKWGCGSE
ncbi:MAG: roadblock/LC7 domain-containing protein [Thiohalorhabdaceae bacterium]